MLTAPFNPRAEKDALYVAFSRVLKEWDTARDVQKILALWDAAERADEVLKTLAAQDSLDHETRLQVVQLKILLFTARQTLDALQDDPLTAVNMYPASEEQHPTPNTIFSVGTILECPQCGEGLYKVTREVSTAGIVFDDGTVLAPLNQTIPPRDTWQPLTCPVCGGRLCKEGKIHTFQDGWQS